MRLACKHQLWCIPFLIWTTYLINCTLARDVSDASTRNPGYVPIKPFLGNKQKTAQSIANAVPVVQISRGGGLPVPAGWNPFGYAITDLGLKFLSFEGTLDSDIGRFLASLKSGRKTQQTLKDQWLEIVRVSKKGQSMRIYRTLDDLIDFCLKAGFID
mmetsp:Transcript_34479/g.46177  ORF Transcript_34479/g.46177 Transcript_34479/m.46177 type:complete len:158 (-) Transcript_34479:254-727(-)